MIQKLKTTYAAKKKQQKQKKIIEEFDAQNAAAIISTMSTIHKANEKLKQSAAPPSTSHNAGFIGEEKQSFQNDDRQTRTYAEIVAVNNTNVAAAPVPPTAPTAVMETKQNVAEEKKKPEKVVQVQKLRTQTPVITLQVPLNASASASPASIGRKVEEAIRATRQSQQKVDHRDIPPSSGASVPPPPAVPKAAKHGYDEYPHPPKEHSSHHGHEQGHHYYHKEHMQYPPPPSHAYKHYPPPPYMHGYPHGPPPPHYHHPHAVSVPVPVPVYSSHGPSPPEYYSTYPAPLHPYYAHAPSVYPHQSAPPPPPAREHRRLDPTPQHRHPRYPYNEKLGYDEQGGYGSKDLFRRIGIYQNKEKTETSTSDASSETHANDMNSTDDAPSEKVSSKEELPKFKPPSSHCNMSTHVREEQAKRKALKDKFEDNVSKNTMDVNNKKSIPKSNSLDYLSSVVGDGLDDM